MNWRYFAYDSDFGRTVIPSKRKDAIEAIYNNEFKVVLEFSCGEEKWYERVDNHKLLRSCNKSNLLNAINVLVADQLKSVCIESYLIYEKYCVVDYDNNYVVFSVFVYK